LHWLYFDCRRGASHPIAIVPVFRASGPTEKLNSTVVSQPAIYVASLAALEKLKEERPEVVDCCNVAAGLSLGEYTALAFAGAMTFEDGLKLVLH
jgi:[acyl-carrier-protein] S-malonyltransferase